MLNKYLNNKNRSIKIIIRSIVFNKNINAERLIHKSMIHVAALTHVRLFAQ